MSPLFVCVAVSTFVVGLACAAPTTSPSSRPVGDDPLRELRDERRVVVLIAKDPNDERLARADGVLHDASTGVAERQITVIRIVGGRGAIGEEVLSPTAVSRVLKHCNATAETPFAVVLIGKDGGVKLRETTPIEIDRLFGLIDSMPMRQREMKR